MVYSVNKKYKNTVFFIDILCSNLDKIRYLNEIYFSFVITYKYLKNIIGLFVDTWNF